ncbi:MAG: hypothetical protein QM795_18050 [Pseudoxanthomonas sp.]
MPLPTTIARFRVFLIASAVLSFAAVATVFLPDGYSPALAEAYANEPLPALFENEGLAIGLGITALAIMIVGWVGLFMLKRWGRALSLGITVLGFPLYLLAGPTLLSPLEAMLTDASTLVWGACLALAYYSPVAARMEGGARLPD